jgi:hypothetical protein
MTAPRDIDVTEFEGWRLNICWRDWLCCGSRSGSDPSIDIIDMLLPGRV